MGYATAAKLSEHGARVIALVRRDLDHAQHVMSQLGKNSYAVLADVTDVDSLNRAASNISKCDILVNAAGVNVKTNPLEITPDEFDVILNVNLKGTYFAIQAFHNLLSLNGGLIVNISSTGGAVASSANLAYGASKAGVDLLTKSLAKSLAPHIRVVGVSPGSLDNSVSGITRNLEQFAKQAERIPLKRFGTAVDVAEMVLSLATTMPYVTGQTIILDGGATL